MKKCPECQSEKIETKWVDEAFDYGDKNPITIKVRIPVRTCQDCKCEYTDEVMEQIREEAVVSRLKGVIHLKESEA